MSERQSYYVGIKGIIRNEASKILILKDVTGKWEVPGGRMDAGQTIEGAFAREISEEIEGAALTEFGNLLYAAQGEFLVEDSHKLLLLFYEVTVELPPHLVLSAEHSDAAWIDARTIENYAMYTSDKAAVLRSLEREIPQR
jgi:8-oxo-dGTP pyrophosphatase MutT (NUDIX family)